MFNAASFHVISPHFSTSFRSPLQLLCDPQCNRNSAHILENSSVICSRTIDLDGTDSESAHTVWGKNRWPPNFQECDSQYSWLHFSLLSFFELRLVCFRIELFERNKHHIYTLMVATRNLRSSAFTTGNSRKFRYCEYQQYSVPSITAEFLKKKQKTPAKVYYEKKWLS